MVEDATERYGPWFPGVLAVTPRHSMTNMGLITQLILAEAHKTGVLPLPSSAVFYKLKPVIKVPTFEEGLETLLKVDDLTALILPVSDLLLDPTVRLPERNRRFFGAVHAYRDLRNKEGCYVPLILIGRYHPVETGGRFDPQQAFFEAARIAGADVLFLDSRYTHVNISKAFSQTGAVFKDPACYRSRPHIAVMGYYSREVSVPRHFRQGFGDRTTISRQQQMLFLSVADYLIMQESIQPYESTPCLVRSFVRASR